MLRNFSYKNLQGRSFKGEVLSGDNFSYADIRGVDFTGANLAGADFSYAKAGMELKWEIAMLILAAFLSGMSGAAAVAAVYETLKFLIPKASNPVPPSILEFLRFLGLLFVNCSLLVVTVRQGIQKSLGIIAGTVAIGVPLIGALAALGNPRHPFFDWFRGFRTQNFIDTASGVDSNSPAEIIVPLAISVVATIAVVVTLSLAVVLATIVTEVDLGFAVKAEAIANSRH